MFQLAHCAPIKWRQLRFLTSPPAICHFFFSCNGRQLMFRIVPFDLFRLYFAWPDVPESKRELSEVAYIHCQYIHCQYIHCEVLSAGYWSPSKAASLSGYIADSERTGKPTYLIVQSDDNRRGSTEGLSYFELFEVDPKMHCQKSVCHMDEESRQKRNRSPTSCSMRYKAELLFGLRSKSSERWYGLRDLI
jgi:hypothetical protein